MSLIWTNLKHVSFTLLLLLVALVCFGLLIGAEAHLFEDPLAYRLDGETHVFYENDALVRRTLHGNTEDGFSVEVAPLEIGGSFDVLFPADDSVFAVTPVRDIVSPQSVYETDAPIIAISDIESGFGAFKEFLIAHGIADAQMNWTFGRGHLVLVGDFVDRGASTTQVLWAIYQLEQSARDAGGVVHFIVGNHEIKFMQGNFQAADEKYFYIAGILGKQQAELYGRDALIGRWMASKNVVEKINGIVFVHGGLHPDIAQMDLAIEDINAIVRTGYRQLYYTPTSPDQESFLRSSTTGPAWYRGYFKEDLSRSDVEASLHKFGAEAVVVGHTLQSEIKTLFDRTVIAIDVRHPKDYLTSFPIRKSEGLLIEEARYYRLMEDGKKERL
ncbi:MAG: metallophosphoesterase [Pseudomonadota bacterium]